MSSVAKVVKSGSAHHGAETTYNFIDLRQRCEAYAANIREQCKSWIVEARGECDAIREKAEADGLAAGRAEGLRQAEEEIAARAAEMAAEKTATALKTASPAVRAAAETLELTRDRWRQEWELKAIQLAVEIAGRLTKAQIAANPALLLGRASEILTLAGGHQDAVLRMHPDDVAAIGEDADRLLEGTAARITADPSIQPGGCVLQTSAGEVDGQLSTQLDRFVEELMA